MNRELLQLGLEAYRLEPPQSHGLALIGGLSVISAVKRQFASLRAKVYGKDICAEAQFLGLAFPVGTSLRVEQNCKAQATTTTTTTQAVCKDLTKSSKLQVDEWSGCQDGADYAVLDLQGSIPLDIVMDEGTLAMVKTAKRQVHQLLSKLVLEDDGDGSVTAKLHASDICDRLAYLKVLFNESTQVSFESNCVYGTTTTTTTTTTAGVVVTSSTAAGCTNLTAAVQLVVENPPACAAGDDHAKLELKGSLGGTFSQEDLELVNLQSSDAHQKLSKAECSASGDTTTVKLFASGICSRVSYLSALFPENSRIGFQHGCSKARASVPSSQPATAPSTKPASAPASVPASAPASVPASTEAVTPSSRASGQPSGVTHRGAIIGALHGASCYSNKRAIQHTRVGSHSSTSRGSHSSASSCPHCRSSQQSFGSSCGIRHHDNHHGHSHRYRHGHWHKHFHHHWHKHFYHHRHGNRHCHRHKHIHQYGNRDRNCHWHKHFHHHRH
ncbi:unnamed protein product [Effrenium voratum]|nr:unnamed protein product [Effrenium voratum]